MSHELGSGSEDASVTAIRFTDTTKERQQPTAEQARDQAFVEVLELLKAEKALAWPERSNFHVAQRIDFINRLKLEVQI